MNKLAEIIAHKQLEVEALLPREAKLRAAAAMRDDFRSLSRALRQRPNHLGLIAEVKKASPSAGVIAPNFDPVLQAKIYNDSGAQAISMLTDEPFFQGKLSYLTRAREMIQVPILRKDFIVHPVQIYEAVVAGADAILLIVAALSQDDLVRLLDIAHTYQLDALVEVHDEAEMERALETEASIVGINNRNLKTFQVDLGTTERLSEMVDDELILVSESGIKTTEDAERVFRSGANAILVGEALMRAGDLPAQIKAFTEINDETEF